MPLSNGKLTRIICDSGEDGEEFKVKNKTISIGSTLRSDIVLSNTTKFHCEINSDAFARVCFFV